MKNKLVCLSLAYLVGVAAMVLAVGSAAICSGMTDAQVCEQLGVLQGSGDGVDASYLAEYTTREQAAYITLRLMGKEAEAKAYTGGSRFSDSNTVAYMDGRRMLNYLKAHPEYGWQGDDAGNISPTGRVNSQAMYKVMLTVLGYSVGEDYRWEETLQFARDVGMTARVNKRISLTNSDLAAILVETLKTNVKDKKQSLCERLIELNVINAQKAYELSMTPGSPGYTPLLPYSEGGPLISEITASIEKRQVTIRFNVNLNPSYAKALRNYEYFAYGKGYIPLPMTCVTSLTNENTIVIQFPEKGWSEGNVAPRDAFITYIATYGRNEIRISGLLDVDGNELDVVYIDVPR